MPAVIFGWLRRRAEAHVRSMAGGRELELMDESANSFGVESRGVTQIRGNGCLALTADEILFVMWLPRRELRISRERISLVERAGSHLGKTVGRPLLRVRFADEIGREDSVAWLVRDLPAWEAALA
jgi:hypothetical protein